MKLYLRLIFTLLSCMAACAKDVQVLESRDSIIAKIQSSKPDALEGWVRLPCVGSYKATVTQTKLDANQDHLVAIVSSIGCDQFSVMVFKKVNDRVIGYRFEDGVKFLSSYSSLPKIEYPEMAEPGIHEIFLTGVVTDAGSGVLQRDCFVLKLLNGKLSTVFEGSEFVRFTVGSQALIQRSRFSVEDSKTFNIAGNQLLREERTESIGSRTITRTRNCFWDGDIRHFSCAEGYSKHSPQSTSRPVK